MQGKIKTLISGRGQHKSVLLLLGILEVLLVSVPGASSIIADEKVSSYDRLYMNLFTNYDKNVQAKHLGQPTNITLSMTVHYIDIDEKDCKITLHCWTRIGWIDDRRSWNPHRYDNLTQLHLRSRESWKPQITLFNAAGDDGNYLGDTHIVVYSEGSNLWVLPAVYTVYCNLNLRDWPYDKQTCKLKLGTWSLVTYYWSHIDPGYSSLDYDELVQSTEWEIVSGQVRHVREDYYNYIEFTFTVQRRSSMYTSVIYKPAMCIVLLALSTFWLPPQMDEKILLNGVLIVLITAFIMYFAQLLPVLAGNTPLIVVFYSASLLLLSISTIVQVIVLYLSTASHKRRLPEFLKQLLNGKQGTWLLLSHFSYEAEPQKGIENSVKELEDQADNLISPLDINATPAPSPRALQYDWVLLATAVDRLCFASFTLVYLVLVIIYVI